ncbi:MAG: NUDIX domain-containing protein [Anaerolineae bacterium]
MTKIIFTTDYFSLEQDSDGINFIRSGDAVVVVPVSDSGQVLLVKEYAPASGGEMEVGVAQADTANRELQEEIGYRAGQLDLIGEIRPWAKYLAVRNCVYLARKLMPSKLKGDEAHPITVRPISLDDIGSLIGAGELHDAVTIAALYLVREHLKGDGPCPP